MAPLLRTEWCIGGDIVRGQVLDANLLGGHLLLQDTSSLSLGTPERRQPPRHIFCLLSGGR